MLKGALVGALALTTGMTSFAAADSLGHSIDQEQAQMSRSHAGPVIREAHIARLRTVLNLKPEQQKFWGPVESALRALARQQAREETGGGFVRRMSDRATSMAGTAVHMRRLASAAGPLVRSLDDSQKSSAMSFVQNAGFGHLAAAF